METVEPPLEMSKMEILFQRSSKFCERRLSAFDQQVLRWERLRAAIADRPRSLFATVVLDTNTATNGWWWKIVINVNWKTSGTNICFDFHVKFLSVALDANAATNRWRRRIIVDSAKTRANICFDFHDILHVVLGF